MKPKLLEGSHIYVFQKSNSKGSNILCSACFVCCDLVASSGHVVFSLTGLLSCCTVISIVVLRYKIMHDKGWLLALAVGG
jgi:hypothetical protein